MKYFVVYNSQYVAMRMSLKGAISEIKKRGYQNSNFNYVYIQDEKGNLYTSTGETIEDYTEWLQSLYGWD